MLEKSDKDLVLFTGNFGSGKTEVAVNYTMWLAKQGICVKLADLDLVNPYFRCREARQPLEAVGVTVIAPQGEYHSSELPILLPHLRGLIEKPLDISILDVGGDNIGATVLASLNDVFRHKEYEMYFVVNKKRPFTGTVDGVIRIMREIESASRLKVTALVGNTHLIDETTAEDIIRGAEFTAEVGKATGLPLAFIGVMEKFLPELQQNDFKYPVLPMTRLLLPPWAMKSPAQNATTHARDRFGKLSRKTQIN